MTAHWRTIPIADSTLNPHWLTLAVGSAYAQQHLIRRIVQGESPQVSLGSNIAEVDEIIKFQAAEIAKMSTIHDAFLETQR